MKKIDKLIEYLNKSIQCSETLKSEGESETQDFGSLVQSISDGLRNFE